MVLKAFCRILAKFPKCLLILSSLLFLVSGALAFTSLNYANSNEVRKQALFVCESKSTKDKFEEIVKNLRFTSINSNNKLNDRVERELDNIVKHVNSHYRKLVDEMRTVINSFVHDDVLGRDREVEVHNFAYKLNTDHQAVSKLANQLDNISVENLAEMINQMSISDHFETLKSFTINLQSLSIRQWSNLLHSIVNSLSTSMQTIQSDVNSTAEKLFRHLNQTISDIANELYGVKLVQIQSNNDDIYQLSFELSHEFLLLSNMQLELVMSDSIELSVNTIIENVPLLNDDLLYMKRELMLKNRAKQLDYLNALSIVDDNSQFEMWLRDLAFAFNRTEVLLLNSLIWFDFLTELHSKFGEYEFQSNLYQKFAQSLHNQKDFDEFLHKLAKFNISQADAIKNVQISWWKINNLNALLNLTVIDKKLGHECQEQNSTLIITGVYVKLSDVITSEKKIRTDLCPTIAKYQAVKILVFLTVFIDCDLDAVGDQLELTIVASKWEIIGANRIMVLDGTPGQAGKDATQTGSFLGVGNEFVNGNSLKITANGVEPRVDRKDGIDARSDLIKLLNVDSTTNNNTGIVTESKQLQ